jgi:hypothetical protein
LAWLQKAGPLVIACSHGCFAEQRCKS